MYVRFGACVISFVDVTIIGYSTFRSKLSEEIQKCKKVKDSCYFDCLNAFSARGSIQGHGKLSDESRERQKVFISLSAFLYDQFWPLEV